MPDILALLGSLAWDVLVVGLASVGFITLMWLSAWAFEPHYAGARDRLRGWFRNRVAWRVKQGHEYLPERPRGDIEGLRRKIIQGRVR